MNKLLIVFVLLLLSGCKVGPDYTTPIPDMPEKFSEDKNQQTNLLTDEELLQWWKRFDDPILDRLLAQTIDGNFDYRIALERIVQARYQYNIQFDQLLPDIFFDAQATRYRSSESFATTRANEAAAAAAAATNGKNLTINPIQNFFQTGLTAIWTIDVFGLLRRTADAAYDQWQATDADASNVYIMVLSATAKTYTNICALQKKIENLQQIVTVNEELLEISKERLAAGLISEQDLQTVIINNETNLINLIVQQAALKINIYSLATLTGQQPEALIADFEWNYNIPSAIGKVPIGLPSDLLRRRPDIRSAERNLAAATEEVGIAVANLFPQFALTGSSASFASNPLQGANIGFSSDRLSDLFTHKSGIWGIGSLMTVPLFDFGKRMANIEVQTSLQRSACLNYEKSVVNALQQVEQNLTSYFSNQYQLNELYKKTQGYHITHTLINDQFAAGLADITQEIQAKLNWLTAQIDLINGEQNLTLSLIDVYQSLGGDW